MSGKPWFRPKTFGYGPAPASWEGWLCTLTLIVLFVATVLLLGDPSPTKPAGVGPLQQLRGDLGLAWLHLPYVTRFALAAIEVTVFLAVALSHMERRPPLD